MSRRAPGRLFSAAAKTPLEKAEQAWVIDLFSKCGCVVHVLGTRRKQMETCVHCHKPTPIRDQGTRQTPGLPDLWVVVPPNRLPARVEGLAFWYEVKREGEKLRPEQQAFRDLCLRAGVLHYWGPLVEARAIMAELGLTMDPAALARRRPKITL